MYNFLELEFKKLYEDIRIFNESTEPRKAFTELRKLLNDIVYYIYSNNEVYHDRNLNFYDNVQLLKEAKLISKSIEEILVKTFKNIKLYEEMIDDYYFENDAQGIKLTKLVDKNFEEIYKIIIWLVLTQGKENYEFLRDNLSDEYKEIFDKYVINEDEFESFIKNIDYYDEEDIKLKAAILVEEGEKYYFGKGVKRTIKSHCNTS